MSAYASVLSLAAPFSDITVVLAACPPELSLGHVIHGSHEKPFPGKSPLNVPLVGKVPLGRSMGTPVPRACYGVQLCHLSLHTLRGHQQPAHLSQKLQVWLCEEEEGQAFGF